MIKLLSLITVADASGDKIDQGTMVRYLQEIVWFPSTALEDYIQWEPIDSNAAKATISYREVTASGVFHFNDEGEVTEFVAERYRDENGQPALRTWSVPLREYWEAIRAWAGELVPLLSV